MVSFGEKAQNKKAEIWIKVVVILLQLNLFPVFIFRRKPRYRNLSHTHCYPTSSPRIEDENTLRVSLQSRNHQVEPTENKLNSSKGLTLYQFWKVLVLHSALVWFLYLWIIFLLSFPQLSCREKGKLKILITYIIHGCSP